MYLPLGRIRYKSFSHRSLNEENTNVVCLSHTKVVQLNYSLVYSVVTVTINNITENYG